MTKEECEVETSKAIMEMRNHIEELEKEISVLLSCKNCPENKGGLLCQKEYEDKCLAQKIQYIKELKEENAELEAKYLQATDEGTSWAHLKSLEQENAELRKRNGKLAGQNASLNRWLGEAITFIKDYMIITIEQNIALKKELNKANEWHYVKDGDFPPENIPLNIITFDKDKKRKLWTGEYKGGNGQWWTGYFNHFIDVPYAWKEIVLPEGE